MIATGLEPTPTSFVNEHSTIWPNSPNSWAELQVLICTVHLTVSFCHLTYAFQTESTLCICLNVKELPSQNRRHIWRLIDCNRTRTHNPLVRKQTLNHLVKLTKWLIWIVSTYLYGAFDCIFLSCHVRISEWIYTLYLPESQETLCSKQAWYLKINWLQRDANPQPLSS